MLQGDSDDLALTVRRHCVARGPNGLSPLQARILEEPKPVRIFSAPTGAGKSFALIRAAERGQRVLFIVPTRRLAQNLAASAVEALGGDERAASKVALWSSDETARLRAELPDVKIARLRIRQVHERGSDENFVVATPESVAFLLLRTLRSGHGGDPFSIADLATRFDHVVFDEFHSIDARGFGLCALVARAVAATDGGAKLTFLSATPIDVLPVLTALGLEREAVAVAAEEVVTEAAGGGSGLRALHGDVGIRLCRHTDMHDLLAAETTALRACLDQGRQVVVILDSLDALHAGKQAFAALFDRLGVMATERLAINSIDDNALADMSGTFVTDRSADPQNFRVLLATSSVELGVTFGKVGLLAMDPGHDALSFVQRIGRVARGDMDGMVLVRHDADAERRKPWLPTVLHELRQEMPPRALTIDRFLDIVLRAARARFEPRDTLHDDAPPTTFRSMPQRAIWAAAVFFHALERAQGRNAKGRRDALASIRPNKVRAIACLLGEVEGAAGIRSHNGAAWANAFLAEAATLRDFAATITVQEPGGRCLKVPLRLIESRPALAAAPLLVDKSGHWVLMLDRPFDAALRQCEKVYREERVQVRLPTGDERSVPRNDAAREAARIMESEAGRPGIAPAQRTRLKAAATLVRLSGLVPPAGSEPAPAGEGMAVL